MAVTPLQPSRLSNQLELLADDIDIEDIDLVAVDGRSFPLREALTLPCTINRTIEGASTLILTVNDRDRTLIKSGILDGSVVEAGVDVLIDGLWFRLAAHSKAGNTVTLTFEDREVMLLRRYPLKTAPKTWWRSWPTGNVTRTQFARGLINDVKEVAIRFVATESKNPDGTV